MSIVVWIAAGGPGSSPVWLLPALPGVLLLLLGLLAGRATFQRRALNVALVVAVLSFPVALPYGAQELLAFALSLDGAWPEHLTGPSTVVGLAVVAFCIMYLSVWVRWFRSSRIANSGSDPSTSI